MMKGDIEEDYHSQFTSITDERHPAGLRDGDDDACFVKEDSMADEARGSSFRLLPKRSKWRICDSDFNSFELLRCDFVNKATTGLQDHHGGHKPRTIKSFSKSDTPCARTSLLCLTPDANPFRMEPILASPPNVYQNDNVVYQKTARPLPQSVLLPGL